MTVLLQNRLVLACIVAALGAVLGIVAVAYAAVLIIPASMAAVVLVLKGADAAVERFGVDIWSPRIAFPAMYSIFFGVGSLALVPGPPAGYEWAIFVRPIPLVVPVMAGIGLVAYYAGTLAASRLPHWVSSVSGHKVDPRELNTSRCADDLLRLAVIWSGLAVVAAAAAFWRSGVPLLSGNDATSRLDLASANGIANALYQTLFVAAAALASVGAFMEPGFRSRRIIAWCAVLSSGVVVGLLLGVRGLIVEMAIVAFLAVHWARRRRNSLLIVAAVAGAGVAFVGLFGRWRDSQFLGGGDAFAQSYLTLGFPEWSLGVLQGYTYWRGTVVAFASLVQAIPVYVPHQHGRLLLAGLAALRPGHQDAADIFVKRLLGLDFSGGLGVPASLLGAFYADFGVAGVIGGMFGTGALLQAMYVRYRHFGSGGWVLATAYATKVAVFSLFATGPAPYLTSFSIPLVIWASWSFVADRHGNGVRTFPRWALAGAAAIVVVPLVIAIKFATVSP